jgi:hypothetical protein
VIGILEVRNALIDGSRSNGNRSRRSDGASSNSGKTSSGLCGCKVKQVLYVYVLMLCQTLCHIICTVMQHTCTFARRGTDNERYGTEWCDHPHPSSYMLFSSRTSLLNIDAQLQ